VIAEDAYVQGALYICMNPLTPQTGPNAERLAQVPLGQAGHRDPRWPDLSL
jgi:hypothetical protein